MIVGEKLSEVCVIIIIKVHIEISNYDNWLTEIERVYVVIKLINVENVIIDWWFVRADELYCVGARFDAKRNEFNVTGFGFCLNI